MTCRDSIGYMRAMAHELGQMAKAADAETVAYYFQMAAMEAQRVLDETVDEAKETRAASSHVMPASVTTRN
jgi:hypothetical protein